MRGIAGLGLGLGLASGCSIWVGAERQQCRSDADCELAASEAELACQAGVCRSVGGASSSGGVLPGSTATGLLGGGTTDEGGSSTGLDEGSSSGGPLALVCEAELLAEALVGIYAFTEQTPLPGVDLRVCDLLDFECVAPRLATVTDAAGLAAIPRLEEGFEGYLEIVAPGYAPYLLMLPSVSLVPSYRGTEVLPAGPFAGRPDLAYAVPLLGEVEYRSIGLVIGTSVDPSLGLVSAAAHPCLLTGEPLTVRILAAGQTTAPFCLHGPEETTSLTREGSCGAINLPPGLTELELVPVADPLRAVLRTPVLSRAGWFTSIGLYPWTRSQILAPPDSKEGAAAGL